jgi:hypothetical protein
MTSALFGIETPDGKAPSVALHGIEVQKHRVTTNDEAINDAPLRLPARERDNLSAPADLTPHG